MDAGRNRKSDSSWESIRGRSPRRSPPRRSQSHHDDEETRKAPEKKPEPMKVEDTQSKTSSRQPPKKEVVIKPRLLWGLLTAEELEQARESCGRDEGKWCPMHGRNGCRKWLRPDVWAAVQHLEAKHGVTHTRAKVLARCCFSLPPEPPTEARPDAAKHRASKAEPCVPVKEKKEKAAQQSSGSVWPTEFW